MSEPSEEPGRDGWGAAASEFINARLDLIRLEAREAGRSAARRAAVAVVAIAAMIAGWFVFVAGIIGWVSTVNGWPWFWVTLGTAGVHFLVAVICLAALRRPSPPGFPITRSELSKDREWLRSLKNPPTPKP